MASWGESSFNSSFGSNTINHRFDEDKAVCYLYYENEASCEHTLKNESQRRIDGRPILLQKKTNVTIETNIQSLNDYCLLHLFSFLNFYDLMNLRTVCKQFKQIVEQNLENKTKLILIDFYAPQTIKIETRDAFDNCLKIVANDSICDILVLMTKLCPKLISLEFIYITIDENIILILTENFHNLRELYFMCISGPNEVILKLIICFGTQLQYLTIRGCRLTEQCLESIIKLSPNLKSLDLSLNADITGQCFHLLNDNLQSLRVSQCLSIDELGLNSIVESKAVDSIVDFTINGMVRDYMIRKICENMRYLKSFHFGCSRDFDDQTDYLSVIGLLKHLEKLSLQEEDTYYGSLDDRALISIMQSCNQLKDLEIHVGSGEKQLVTDMSLALISKYCPLIENLKIYYSEAVTDKSLNSFAKLKNLKQLELINLYNLTDEGVIIITELCTELTKLCISFDRKYHIEQGITNLTLIACIEMSRKRKYDCIEIELHNIKVPSNLVIPPNMQLRVSWYGYTPEGCCFYTEIKLPTGNLPT